MGRKTGVLTTKQSKYANMRIEAEKCGAKKSGHRTSNFDGRETDFNAKAPRGKGARECGEFLTTKCTRNTRKRDTEKGLEVFNR